MCRESGKETEDVNDNYRLLVPQGDRLWRTNRGPRPTAHPTRGMGAGQTAAVEEDLLELPLTAADAVKSGWAKPPSKKNGKKNKQSKNFCSLCRVGFPSGEAILAHVREKHPPRRYEERKEPPVRFTCFVCGVKFASLAEQDRHVSAAHLGVVQREEEEQEVYYWPEDDGRRRGISACEDCGLEIHPGIPCLTTLYFCTDCPSARLYT